MKKNKITSSEELLQQQLLNLDLDVFITRYDDEGCAFDESEKIELTKSASRKKTFENAGSAKAVKHPHK
jgi:hypothetical protein